MKLTNLAKYGAVLALAAFTCGHASAQAVSTTTTTTSAGTISDFSGDSIVIRTESAPEPIRYTYTKQTTYVDEAGAPVSMELVKSGLPVTVYYVKDGERMVASKVIVRKRTTTTKTDDAPAVIEKKTTTTTTEEK